MTARSQEEKVAASPRTLRAEQSAAFVLSFLGTERRRVLVAGCGEGRLLTLLAEAGHDVQGVETDDALVHKAWARHLPVEEIDLLVFDGGPFDAVVFGGSLHRMAPLPAVVDKAAWLLVSDGLVILDEPDADAADAATASWFYDTQDLLAASGVLAPESTVEGAPASRGAAPLQRWRDAFARDEGPSHDGRAMRAALKRRFNLVEEFRAPWLYGELLERLERSPRGRRVAEELLRIERRRIDAGELAAVGLRLVARRL